MNPFARKSERRGAYLGSAWSVIYELAKAENEGCFDEVAPELGAKVWLKGSNPLSAMELIVASLDEKTAQLFRPFLAV